MSLNFLKGFFKFLENFLKNKQTVTKVQYTEITLQKDKNGSMNIIKRI